MMMIIVIPIIFFSVYEYSNVRKYEEMIQKVYSSQLEAILNSINKYIDGIFNDWADEIQEYDNMHENYSSYRVSVHSVFTTNRQGVVFHSNTSDSLFLSIFDLINKKEIKALQEFYKNDYRKMETKVYKNWVVVYFIAPGQNNRSVVSGFVIDPLTFFRNDLSPYFQSITEERFNIFIFDRDNLSAPVYTTDRESEPNKVMVRKYFWHFDHFQLGIALKDRTIQELIHDRKKINIWSIIILDLLILIVAIFIYHNIKREVELTRLKSEFVANVSHEIRTPLSLINMYIETLEMGRVKTNEKRAEYYQIISHETKRLTGLVNRILNFSKIENNKKLYTFEKVELNGFMQQLIENYKYHFVNKGFKWNFQPSDEKIMVDIDEEAMSDALNNVIDNALKYSTNTKKLDMQVSIRGSYAYIKVQDYGIGVSAKNKKKIFDKFYRVPSGKQQAYKVRGAGLGLSIVQKIVDEHQGKINVESELGKGSIFTIYLPVNHQYKS
jgi:two-component system phosphate regulon sensor histidine kinase PhoR